MKAEEYEMLKVGDRVLYNLVTGMLASGKIVEKAKDIARITDESLTLHYPPIPFTGNLPPIHHYNWIYKERIIERLQK